MNPAQQLRYSRQVLLPEVGEQGQQKLLDGEVLLLGLGGLGSAASQYLAGAGVGCLYLADFDQLDSSNLQRQTLYRQDDLGVNKAEAAAAQLRQINPDIEVEVIPRKMDEEELDHLLASVDLVLDCSDNLATRYQLNEICVSYGTPLISGAATGWDGQLILFDFADEDTEQPCYHCLYPKEQVQDARNCNTVGIIGPVVGTIGTMQALMAIQYLLGQPPKAGELNLFDGRSLSWQKLQLPVNPSCAVCSEEDLD